MRCRGACIALVFLALAGCARSVKFEAQFDEESRLAAEDALKPGPGRITGTAFMRKKSGATVTNAGDWVYLVPATPYAQLVIETLFEDKQFSSAMFGNRVDVDANFWQLTRRVKANRGGYFVFDKVPLGRYFLMTKILWYPADDEYVPYGGLLYEAVDVRTPEPVEVVLSSVMTETPWWTLQSGSSWWLLAH